MKIRPLPETDLANTAALPLEKRRKRLEGIKLTHPPHTYNPSRACLSDILNEQSAMLGALPASKWEPIARKISSLSDSDTEEAANIGVSKPLHTYVTERSLFGRALNMTRMALGFGVSVEYWAATGLVIDQRLVTPFLDFRRHGLTPMGRQIVFSLMHEHIATRYPDFLDAQLVIIQFTDGDERRVVFQYADGMPLLEYDELQARIEETYKLWFEVLEERTETMRRAGGKGGMF